PAADLLAAGVRIPGGQARCRGRLLAELSFAPVPGPYPFVLSLPQAETEGTLERHLERAGVEPRRGVEVTGLRRVAKGVVLQTNGGEIEARFVVAADGARSAVRGAAGIAAPVRTYPDAYVMGDFAETSGGEADARAVLYLEPAGVVESFPLPGARRRWVVRTGRRAGEPELEALVEAVRRRTGVVLDPGSNSMLSAFGVRRRIAEQFSAGRVALVGDAAHEISPIGGQGMNLGWLDAVALAPHLLSGLSGEEVGPRLESWAAQRRAAARAAAQRAHLNMALGRPVPGLLLPVRNGLLGSVAAVPSLHDAVARTFTMTSR
uniref:FAD-dependent oxidoreductase n=1 Tax=Zhihengliuella halotolerans TaxID=370736 RepID=UPI000C7F836B